MEIPFRLRDYDQETDEGFLKQAWRKAHRNNVIGMGMGRYYDYMTRHMDSRINGGSTYVACDENERDFLYGAICCDKERVHFVYVKSAFRRNGIAKALLKHAFGEIPPIILCDSWSRIAIDIAANKPGLVYAPQHIQGNINEITRSNICG